MCNLCNVTTSHEAMIEWSQATRDLAGNLEPSIDIYPDYLAPIVPNSPAGGRQLLRVRWGLPSSRRALAEAASRLTSSPWSRSRKRIRNRLTLAVRMFQDMGWGGIPEGRDVAWFAPLPAADGPLAESEFLIAIDAEDATYVAPYELPWLTNDALDYRRSEMMVEPPSMTRN